VAASAEAPRRHASMRAGAANGTMAASGISVVPSMAASIETRFALLHLVARAADGALPLATRTACVDLWSRLVDHFDVIACALMPDHVHLFARVDPKGASRTFAQILAAFRSRGGGIGGVPMRRFRVGTAAPAGRGASRSTAHRADDTVHPLEPLPRRALRRSARMGVEHAPRLDGSGRAAVRRHPSLEPRPATLAFGRRFMAARIHMHRYVREALQAAGRRAPVPGRFAPACLPLDARRIRDAHASKLAPGSARLRSRRAAVVSALGGKMDEVSRVSAGGTARCVQHIGPRGMEARAFP